MKGVIGLALVLGLLLVWSPGQTPAQEIEVGTFSGKAVDGEGKAHPGARVLLALRMKAGGFPQLPAGRFRETDDEGRFAFEGIPVGTEVHVQVRPARAAAGKWAPGFSKSVTIKKGKNKAGVVRLTRSVEILGVVKDQDGKPAPGIHLQARITTGEGGGWNPSGMVVPGSAATAADGSFRISGLPKGTVRIEAAARGGRNVQAMTTELIARPAKAPAKGVQVRLRKLKPVDIEAGEGIAWEERVTEVLRKARLQNRPILLCINALDEEFGNRTMAFVRYRDRRLIAATRAALCLVASPNDHGPGEICRRFGRIPCAAHKAVLNWAMARYAVNGSLVSPQHFILAPNQDLLFRKEFWIDADVLQRELESALVKVSPRGALSLAFDTRKREFERLEKGGDPKPYLQSNDPLAPAVLLNLYEETEEARFRDALKGASREAFGLIRLFVKDDPTFIPVARAVHPEKGAWWARYHAARRKEVPPKGPPPSRPELKAAFLKLQAGDRSGLELLLGALTHPVDGPEVRAAFASIVGEDLGMEADVWREQLSK